MTSIPRSRIPEHSQAYMPSQQSLISKNICAVVGLTCLAGFMIDLLVLGSPPNPFSLQWRVTFLQQVGDRSIILLFGIALLLYSIFEKRQIKRPLSLFCMALGVAFLLSSILIIRDSLILKDQAFRNISQQEEQLQTQIEASRSSEQLPQGIGPEQLRQASQEITNRAQAAKQNTSQGINKAGIASLGNLIVVGVGLIGLGRIGFRKGL